MGDPTVDEMLRVALSSYQTAVVPTLEAKVAALTTERDDALKQIEKLEADNRYLSNAVLRLQQEPKE